jgi:hypothetical protein
MRAANLVKPADIFALGASATEPPTNDPGSEVLIWERKLGEILAKHFETSRIKVFTEAEKAYEFAHIDAFTHKTTWIPKRDMVVNNKIHIKAGMRSLWGVFVIK